MRFVPAAIGALVLLMPVLVSAWNGAATSLGRKAWRISVKPLAGEQIKAPAPEFTAHSFWSGQFAQQAALQYGQQLSILPWAVRLKNQIFYSVLRTSPVPSIAIGERRQLFETAYLDEYCTRDLASFAPQAESWVRKLRQIQDYYEAQQQVFLYVITPSKAAVYPEFMPKWWPCAGKAEDRRGYLATYERLLEAHGVNFVDAAALVAESKRKFAVGVFPREGTHWNEIGATLGAQAITAAINRHDPPHRFEEFAFTWQPGRPVGQDLDLLRLLNLMRHDVSYLVPRVTIEPSAAQPAPCSPPRLVMIGGSFNWSLLELLQRGRCKPMVSFWYYFQTLHAAYPASLPLPVIPADVTPALAATRDRELLAGADAVILEENEQLMARSKHGPALFEYLKPYMPTEASRQ